MKRYGGKYSSEWFFSKLLQIFEEAPAIYGAMDTFIESAVASLRTGGRLAIIAFHSLEDRIVKHTFRRLVDETTTVRAVTRKPIRPTDAETEQNPRARSARLRGVEKVAAVA